MNLNNTLTLETERLILRKFKEDDIEALYRILKDKEVNTFLPWFPLESLEEAEVFFQERFESKYRQSCAYHYAVCLKSNQIPIGYVNVDMNSGSHDLGYGLCKEFWHRGIMTEACRAVVRQLKNDGVPYITATHDRNNPRSGSVMKQLGMRYQYSYEELVQPKNVLVTFRMYQLNLDGGDSRVYQKYWNESAVHFVEEVGNCHLI